MSHTKVKTKYMEIGAYGQTEWHTLYCHHNHSCDIVSFHDENGNHIFSYGDTEHPSVWDAMQKLVFPYKEKWGEELEEGVEYLNEEDRNKLNYM